MQALTLEKTLN